MFVKGHPGISHSYPISLPYMIIKTLCGSLNIMIPSYWYIDSDYEDKTASRPSYLYVGKHHTCEHRLYIVTGVRLIFERHISIRKTYVI